MADSPRDRNPPDHSDLAVWLSKLSDLNIRMMQHLNSIPEVGPEGSVQSEQEQIFGIDETFHVSQLFIDTLSQICSRLPPPPVDNNYTPRDKSDASILTLDPASELLVFSNYLRLLETYDRIFRQMQACLARKQGDSSIKYPFQMPGLTIGSFNLSSKSETQSLFLVNLMEAMLTRSRDLVSEMASPKDTLGYRGNFECFGGVSLVIVPDLALRAIRTREAVTLKLVDNLKKTIMQSKLS